jgi:hypothetical protein
VDEGEVIGNGKGHKVRVPILLFYKRGL